MYLTAIKLDISYACLYMYFHHVCCVSKEVFLINRISKKFVKLSLSHCISIKVTKVIIGLKSLSQKYHIPCCYHLLVVEDRHIMHHPAFGFHLSMYWKFHTSRKIWPPFPQELKSYARPTVLPKLTMAFQISTSSELFFPFYHPCCPEMTHVKFK